MWNNLKYKISAFMYGRYGLDDLGKFLLVIGLISDLIAMFTNNLLVYAVSIVCFAFLLVRFFSKDIYKRQRENASYRGILQLLVTKFQLRKDYKVFKCRKCNRTIRVPRHHGKVEVTCPLCGEVKIVYSGRKRG